MATKNLTAAQLEARRCNARQSTGPRSRRGKRHSSRNARKHGLYSDVKFFFWDAALELGEDPREFQRLFSGLMEARRPADTLEQVLVEEIAVLIWKKARLERSEAAVQVCNVRKHDLERRKQFIQVGRDVSTVSQSEALEKGLRVTLDAPGKFERVLSMLGVLEEMTERNEFTADMRRLLCALYGTEPTLRGAGLSNNFLALEELRPEGQEFEDAKTLFKARLAEETSDVLGEYELFLHEHVENTRAARIAAMAPSHAQWAAIIRQQNALHRQLERKIQLLDEMQERRRKAGSTSDALSMLAGLHDPSGKGGGQATAGGGGASRPTTPSPSSVEEGSRYDSAPHAPGASPCEEGSRFDCSPIAPDACSPSVGARHGVPLPESATAEGGESDLSAPTGVAGAFPQSGRRNPGSSATAAGLGMVRETPAPAEKTENRGNEAKKSLKTKEVAKKKCAKRTHSCAPNAANEAKKGAFGCKRRKSIQWPRAAHPPQRFVPRSVRLSVCSSWRKRRYAKRPHVCGAPH